MNPYELAALQWLGVPISCSQYWELLELNESQVFECLESKSIKVPKDGFQKIRGLLECAAKNKIKILPFWGPHYPEKLREMQRPPLLLSVLGNEEALSLPSLAVVGSRKINFNSQMWLERELKTILQEKKYIIASGGAVGVDHLAHKISVLYSRPTQVWLPSGLGEIYPNQLRPLVEDIIMSGGVLVSTYSPFQKMRKHHFIERNQFIACSSELTLVVQAKRKSGTLITARAAADMGRPVAVVPSFPFEEGLGGLDLIMDGAALVRDAKDVLDILSISQ